MNDNQIKLNVPAEKLKSYKCPACESEYFTFVIQVKPIPAVLAPSSDTHVMFVQFIKCDKCGLITDMKTLKNEKKTFN